MEVTKANFKEKLKDVSAAIDKAEFIAIDGEFTGLTTPGYTINSLDTPAERYAKLRKGGADFLLMQFGMCCFHHDEESQKYVNQCYNFYVFPRPYNRQSTDLRFMCQSSSIDFLISQGFDFNKVFKDGISYLPPGEEQRLREQLLLKHEQQRAQKQGDGANHHSPNFTSPNLEGNSCNPLKGPIPVPEEHANFIKTICQQIEEFQSSDKDSLHLPPCNAFLRKLTFSNVAPKFKPNIHLESVSNEKKQRCVLVTRVKGENDLQNREQLRQAKELADLDDAVGFTKVIQMISKSGKLVVGHNMILDLLHTLHQFSCPLPEDYEDFKSLTNCVFPRLMDTKVMSSMYPFKEHLPITVLEDLHKSLEKPPFTKPNTESVDGLEGYSTESEKLHEAGYDAYITGLCFISMSNYLGTFQKPVASHIPSSSSLMQPFLNKLHLMRSLDVPYMSLDGPDLNPSREHVFHMTFPKEWKYADINMLFAPYGPVQTIWLNESSAFISLHNKDCGHKVMADHRGGIDKVYTIMTYDEYKQRNTTQTSALKRKIPSSDVDLPPKRRKSRGRSGSPTLPGTRNIETIPEEEEGDDSPDGVIAKSGSELVKDGSSISDQSSVNGADSDEDMGEPVPRKKSKMSKESVTKPIANKGQNKMFEEPEAW